MKRPAYRHFQRKMEDSLTLWDILESLIGSHDCGVGL
jgi:hypothetical protein